jgi:PTS system mannose-specific IIA component
MSVKIILLTHENVGNAMIKTAETTLDRNLNQITIVPVNSQDDPDHIYHELQQVVSAHAHDRDAFLFLTDMVGSTPCNIAQRLLDCFSSKKIAVVSGLNLPMLLKVLNYHDQPLHVLEEKAINGGKNGVCHCTSDKA